MYWRRDAATGRWVRTATRPASGGILSRAGTGKRPTPAPSKAQTKPQSKPQPANGKPAWLLEPEATVPWSLDGEPPMPRVLLRDWSWSTTVIVLAPSARERIEALVRGTALETGGILCGPRHSPNEIAVTSVGHAGPRSERTTTSIRHDGEHDQQLAEAIASSLPGSAENGSWHTHPALFAGVDRLSERDIARAGEMLTLLGDMRYLDLVITPDERQGFDRPTISAWITRNEGEAGRTFYVAERASVRCREPGRAVLRTQGMR